MKRYECVQAMEPLITDELFVLNQGGESVEWMHIHPSEGNLHGRTMGLCSSIGLGLALSLPHRRIVVLDGDGSLLMNFGTLATIGWHQPKNLVHVLFDNGVYESSGGQSTASSTGRVDFAKAAEAAGIPSVYVPQSVNDFRDTLEAALHSDGPHFVWTRVEPGRMPGTRPRTTDELESKYHFVRHIEKLESRQIFRPYVPGSLRVSTSSEE